MEGNSPRHPITSTSSWCIQIHRGPRQHSVRERHGAQLGPLDALLLTKDCFLIHIASSEPGQISPTDGLGTEVGLQVSRNLYQYFRADADIVFSDKDVISHKGNVVTIAHGTELKQSLLSSYPITVVNDKGVFVRDNRGHQHLYAFRSGLGILCLRPLPQERLEAVIWGYDSAGLRYAARLLPLMTVSCFSNVLPGLSVPVEWVSLTLYCLCKIWQILIFFRVADSRILSS